jgi:lipopolysaccharide/colanic/teichoic acid biosynthesis glycosyltransferase
MPLVKRLFDLAAAGFGVLVISPLILLLALLVWAVHGTPILFRQQRPGFKGRPFIIYKFRTMTDRTASDGTLLPDSERLTRLGRFLRSISLDELPELYNVLRGDMSLVGPRPLLMEYLELYSDEEMRRHEVVPGITGWAQVNGRNALSWDEKFKLDVWYVDHWSFWLDIRILFLTFWKMMKREGISQPGHATMEKFKGK